VILFLKTRPNLLLMTPPPGFDNAPSQAQYHKRRGENDQFAHAVSLENGHDWVGGDRATVVEGYERTPSDDGNVANGRGVVRMASSLGLEVVTDTKK
jgi:hypothetical protein